MFIGVSLFNLFNLLFHLFMLRMLPPIVYGHLNTLVALFMIISVPAGTVQTTVTKFVSSFQAQDHYDHVKSLLRRIFILMLIIALALFFLISLASSLISSFLNISSYNLIILLGAGLFFAMLIPVPSGGLQGLQRFGALVLSLLINGGLKLVLGILFVFLGLNVLGAMGAVAIAYIITFILSFIMLKRYLPKKVPVAHQEEKLLESNPLYMSEIYYYFFPAGITLLCFMLLTNIDLILVKHFFAPIDAGYYSIAQMIGKIILFLPLPIAAVMFPKLSSLKMKTHKAEALSILGKSLAMASSLCIVAMALCFLFPSFIIQVFRGEVYSECVPLIKVFSVNMTFFSLSFILLYYQLSTAEKGFLYPLCFLTLLQTGLILFFHKTLMQILFMVGMVAFSVFAVNLCLIYIYHRRH